LAKTHSENLFKDLNHSSYSEGEHSFIFNLLWRHTVSLIISEMRRLSFHEFLARRQKNLIQFFGQLIVHFKRHYYFRKQYACVKPEPSFTRNKFNLQIVSALEENMQNEL
jgi:hypothetical protein